MRPSLSRPVVAATALVSTATLILAGCSSGAGTSASSPSSAPPASSSSTPSSSVATTPAPSPSSTVQVPGGTTLTRPGSTLSFGDVATVAFEPSGKHGSVVEITVETVRKGSRKDFSGFVLDDPYKKNASYYYAMVQVKNIGDGDVGGVPVPLRGVSGSNTLLPPVMFTTRFAPCPTRSLPATFGPGRTLRTCLVFLSPGHGSLESVSFRPSEEFNPITWSGRIGAASSASSPTPSSKRTTPRDR